MDPREESGESEWPTSRKNFVHCVATATGWGMADPLAAFQCLDSPDPAAVADLARVRTSLDYSPHGPH